MVGFSRYLSCIDPLETRRSRDLDASLPEMSNYRRSRQLVWQVLDLLQKRRMRGMIGAQR